MRQSLILPILVIWLICSLLGAYFIYSRLPKDGGYLSTNSGMTSQMYLSDTGLEEELVYYLVKKLGVYQGAFEILDVINLDTRNVVGADYILITLKSPDGKLCQITVSRKFYPWARWEINPQNLSVVDLPQPGLAFRVDLPRWVEDLGITAKDAYEYYKAHPKMDLNIESTFFDEKTGKFRLPADWFEAVKTPTQHKLEITKDERLRLISNKTKKEGLLNSYWKLDYPSEYIGPGYRVYLYGKIKKEQ